MRTAALEAVYANSGGAMIRAWSRWRPIEDLQMTSHSLCCNHITSFPSPVPRKPFSSEVAAKAYIRLPPSNHGWMIFTQGCAIQCGNSLPAKYRVRFENLLVALPLSQLFEVQLRIRSRDFLLEGFCHQMWYMRRMSCQT
jgi:hypothetical protein